MKKIISLLIAVLIVSYGCCFAISNVMGELITNNMNTAAENERPTANISGFVDNPGDVWDRIPGQGSDGYTVGFGELSAEGQAQVTDNTHAATLNFPSDAFQDSNGNFDVGQYNVVRAEVASYLIDNPTATEAEVNAYLHDPNGGNIDPGIQYIVADVRVGPDGAMVCMYENQVVGIVSLLGTSENADGSISPSDILAIPSWDEFMSLPADQRLAYLELAYYQQMGYLDLLASAGMGEDEEQTTSYGTVWHESGKGSYSYSHMDPTGEAKIYSDIYDVEKGIPTSENLNFIANNVDDILYSVKVNSSWFKAGCVDIPIYQTCSFTYWVPKKEAVYGTYTTGEHSGEEYLISAEVPAHFESSSARSDDYFEQYTYTRPTATCLSVSPSIYQAEYVKVSEAPTDGPVSIPFEQETLNYNVFSSHFSNPVDPPVTNPTLINVGNVSGVVGKEYAEAYAEAKAIAETRNDGKIAEAKSNIEGEVNSVPGGTVASVSKGTEAHFDFRGFDITPGADNSDGSPEANVKKINGKDQPVIKMIPWNKLNGTYDPVAMLHYTGYYIDKPIDVNDVFVHTPVIDLAYAESDPFADQRVTKIEETAIQLDTGFRVVFPNNGTHRDIDGYKTRDYISNQAVTKFDTNWGYVKDVKCDFDVYLKYVDSAGALKTIFIPANQWVGDTLPEELYGLLSSREYYFIVPVWVTEGSHTIMTEVVAENAIENNKLSDSFMQEEANLDPEKYIATKEIKVEIVGKIYDLQVNNSTDVDWLNKVQNMDLRYNLDYVPANEFPFGQTRASAGFRSQNSNAGYKYAPKLGYTFSFNFKTKGRKSETVDVKVSESGFYFVSKGTGKVTKVDLYYKSPNGGDYKKIGASNDGSKIKISYKQDNNYLKIPSQEMVDSTRIYNIEKGKPYNYDNRINAGSLAKLLLPNDLRLTFNNMREYMTNNGGKGLYIQTKEDIESKAAKTNEPGADVVTGSIGRWYVGYKLPSSTVAVDSTKVSGYNESRLQSAITNKESGVVLENGYILVTMDIISNDTAGSDYLRYDGPKALNINSDGTVEEKPDENPERDWTEPYDPNDEDKYVEISLPDINNPVKVPNNTVAIFETLNAADDRWGGIEY